METLNNLLLEQDYLELENTFADLVDRYITLTEGWSDTASAATAMAGNAVAHPHQNIADLFDETLRRLEAAKRGIGLTNKLPVGPERSQHRSRIMGNLNRIRALVANLIKTAESGSFSTGQEQQVNTNRNAV